MEGGGRENMKEWSSEITTTTEVSTQYITRCKLDIVIIDVGMVIAVEG